MFTAETEGQERVRFTKCNKKNKVVGEKCTQIHTLLRAFARHPMFEQYVGRYCP